MSGPRLRTSFDALAHNEEWQAWNLITGQPAPGEKEAWNADALMEGVRVGSGRGNFLAAFEDRVKAEEMQWAPLLQLHIPDQLDGHLNKVLVETGQRFFKKEPTDAPGYADLAARRRELLTQRLEARKNIGEDGLQGQEGIGWKPGRTSARMVSRGRRAWNVRRSFSRRSASQRNSWRARQHLSRQSDFG